MEDELVKTAESRVRELQLDPRDLIVVRLDGCGFSKWTKRVGVEKPYDQKLGGAMVYTAEKLMEEWHAHVAYTCSDEITLFFVPPDVSSRHRPPRRDDKVVEPQLAYSGRVQKWCSIMSAKATAFFHKALLYYFFDAEGDTLFDACFDAKVMSVSRRRDKTMDEMIGVFLRDRVLHSCIRNSKSMYGHHYLGAKGIFQKTGNEIVAHVAAENARGALRKPFVPYTEMDPHFLRGTMITRDRKSSTFLVPAGKNGDGATTTIEAMRTQLVRNNDPLTFLDAVATTVQEKESDDEEEDDDIFVGAYATFPMT